jgi:hypothetical protein
MTRFVAVPGLLMGMVPGAGDMLKVWACGQPLVAPRLTLWYGLTTAVVGLTPPQFAAQSYVWTARCILPGRAGQVGARRAPP